MLKILLYSLTLVCLLVYAENLVQSVDKLIEIFIEDLFFAILQWRNALKRYLQMYFQMYFLPSSVSMTLEWLEKLRDSKAGTHCRHSPANAEHKKI